MFDITNLLILALGLLIGWALGAARVNGPLVAYFRDYYRRQAEARVRQHTDFLLSTMKSFGAALDSHRRAASAGFDGGRRSPRVLSLRVFRMRIKPHESRRKEGDSIESY